MWPARSHNYAIFEIIIVVRFHHAALYVLTYVHTSYARINRVSLVGLSAGALRCVVYRECTARLLKAGRVTPVDNCTVTTSTRLQMC